MRRVFADTLYWVALVHRRDQWHPKAVEATRLLGEAEWSKYSNVSFRRCFSSYFRRQACIRRVYRELLTTRINHSQACLNCCITKRLVSTHHMVDHTSMG